MKPRRTGAEEAEIRAYRRARILEMLDMDSLYTQAGDWLTPMDAARMLDITPVSAAHCMSGMCNDGILMCIQRRSRSKKNVENVYKRQQKGLLEQHWLMPTFRPKKFYDLGAPM